MRRKDREIRDFQELVQIMRSCDVVRFALADTPVPYLLPLNFGLELRDGTVCLYVHGAMEGTKYRLMEQNGRAAFEMDRGHRLVLDTEDGVCTMEYQSVIGQGALTEITEPEEKMAALRCVMAHYREPDFPFSEEVARRTRVWALRVETMTGKQRRVRTKNGQTT